MTTISAVFTADYYGSQKDCYLSLDGKEYCGRLDDEMQDFIFDYVETQIIDEIKSPTTKTWYWAWYWVLKEGKTKTGSIAYNDDFTIEYDLRGAALTNKSQMI